jgi:hypothetical protein
LRGIANADRPAERGRPVDSAPRQSGTHEIVRKIVSKDIRL